MVNIIEFGSMRVKKFNRSTYVFDGDFQMKIDMDDSVSVEVVANNFHGILLYF